MERRLIAAFYWWAIGAFYAFGIGLSLIAVWFIVSLAAMGVGLVFGLADHVVMPWVLLSSPLWVPLGIAYAVPKLNASLREQFVRSRDAR